MSDIEIVVCNFGLVNFVVYLVKQVDGSYVFDYDKLKCMISVVMCMFDNVIDINYYVVLKVCNLNLKYCLVGMGIMGFQDCLYLLCMLYVLEVVVEFVDCLMEVVCYYVYYVLIELVEECGCYLSYCGLLWDCGIFLQDMLKLLMEVCGGYVEVDMLELFDWMMLCLWIVVYGMCNLNCVVIVLMVMILNIIGVLVCIELIFQNLYVKLNLLGEFMVVNEYFVCDLKECGLWDEVMVVDLKYFDGMLLCIDCILVDLCVIYVIVFEVDLMWLVEVVLCCQKWIDQVQLLNIYMGGVLGKKFDEVYKFVWLCGLKMIYYFCMMVVMYVEKLMVVYGVLNVVLMGGVGSGSLGSGGV